MNYTFELKELQATHYRVSSSSRRYKLDPKLYQKAYAMGRAKRTYKRSGK